MSELYNHCDAEFKSTLGSFLPGRTFSYNKISNYLTQTDGDFQVCFGSEITSI